MGLLWGSSQTTNEQKRKEKKEKSFGGAIKWCRGNHSKPERESNKYAEKRLEKKKVGDKEKEGESSGRG